VPKFLIIDTNHLFHRVKHVVHGETHEKPGMLLHAMFMSLNKVWRKTNPDHAVFCFDSESWRKGVYSPYKAHRDKIEDKTPTEIEQDRLMFEAFRDFREFLADKTACTVLKRHQLESDDLVSGFIQAHPTDEHIIMSGDGDFIQLLGTNVSMYDGLNDRLFTLSGIYDASGKLVIDKKTGEPLPLPDPAWSVFEKAIRGCTSDNIFSAYPGVRKKGSKNKVGLLEAFEDRHKKGFAWSSIMYTRWNDHTGIEHRVMDDYQRNVMLVDLTQQPDNIKEEIAMAIFLGTTPKPVLGSSLNFLKFCRKNELHKLEDNERFIAPMLSAKYPCETTG